MNRLALLWLPVSLAACEDATWDDTLDVDEKEDIAVGVGGDPDPMCTESGREDIVDWSARLDGTALTTKKLYRSVQRGFGTLQPKSGRAVRLRSVVRSPEAAELVRYAGEDCPSVVEISAAWTLHAGETFTARSVPVVLELGLDGSVYFDGALVDGRDTRGTLASSYGRDDEVQIYAFSDGEGLSGYVYSHTPDGPGVVNPWIPQAEFELN